MPEMTDASFCRQAQELFETGLVPWPTFRFADEQRRLFAPINGIGIYTGTPVMERWHAGRSEWEWVADFSDYTAACIIAEALRVWLLNRLIDVRQVYLKHTFIAQSESKDEIIAEKPTYREALLAACRAIGEKEKT